MQNVSFISLAEYGIKYYHTHTDDSGTTVRVRIYQHGFTGAAQEFGGLRTLRLDIQGGTDDITAPIVKTSLTMTLADTPEFSTAGRRMGGWSEFYTPDATKYYITVERSVTGGYALLWAGYVTPDSWSESLGVDGDITITVRDNIGHLSDFPFDGTPDENGLISVEGLILAALTKIKFPMALHYYTAAEAQVAMLTSGGTTLWDAKVNVSHFGGKDWGEVLEEVLGDLGLALRFVGGGAYWVGPLRDLPKMGGNTIRSSANDIALTFIGSNNLRQIDPAYKQIIETASYETNSEKVCDLALGRTGYSNSTSVAYKLGITTGNMTAWKVTGAVPGWNGNIGGMSAAYLNPAGLSVGSAAQAIYGSNYTDGCFITANRTSPVAVRYAAKVHTSAVTLRLTIDARPAGIYNGNQLDCYPFCQAQSVKYRIYYYTGTAGFRSWYGGGWEAQGSNPDSRYIMEATFGGQTGEDFTVEVPLIADTDAGNDGILYLQIEDIQFTDTLQASSFYLTGCYARVLAVTMGQAGAEALVGGNVVTTVNDESMNVTLNRKPSLAALSYDSGRIDEQTYENVLYRLANSIPTPWGYTCQWGDQSTALPFPVQNHLALLCYHFTGMEVLEGDCIQSNGQSWRVDAIHSYKGARFILLGGTLDLVTGRMLGATFHTFVEFIDTWGTSPSVDYTVNEGAAGNTSGTGSGYSGGGASGGGGGGVTPTPSSLDEYFASLQSQIDSVSSRNSFDELLATVLNTDILAASSIYGETLEVTGGAAIGGAASVGGQLSAGSIKLAAGTPVLSWDSTNSAWHLTGNFYADGWISAGGVGSGGGGGGGGTTVAWGTATSNYTPLTVGSDTRNLSLAGHKHDTSDINDFSTAVAALIAGSDLATTVAGHTTAINTLNGYFTNGVLGVTHGGTGLSSLAAGDMLYASAANTLAALAGNGTATKKFLTMTSGTPSWGSIAAGDLPTLYWADVQVSDQSNGATSPTFNTATVSTIKAVELQLSRNKGGTAKAWITMGGGNTTYFELIAYGLGTIMSFGNPLTIGGKEYFGYINDLPGKGILIDTSKLHLTAQLTFKGEQSDSGNTFDKGLEYDSTNHAWHLKGNLYADGFISAGGVGSGGGGGGSVVSWTTDIGTDTANVIGLQVGSESHFFYTKPWGDALDLRVQSLEAGSALTITTTGSGNAVTDVSKSGTVITVTKGATFLTPASLDGAEAALASLQSQVDSVSARNSYDELSATVFNADIITASDIYGELTGNAATATKVNNALTISTTAVGAASNTTYDGSAAKTIYSPTQMLNTTSTPTFAGLVDNGALTVKGSTTLGDNAQSDYLDVNAITTIAGTVTMQSTLNAIGYTAIGTIPSHTLLSNQLTVFGTSRFQGSVTISNGAHSVTLSISQDGYLEVEGDMYATGFISAGGVS